MTNPELDDATAAAINTTTAASTNDAADAAVIDAVAVVAATDAAVEAATAKAQAALGDALNCPVCLNVFSSRIRQCRFGHSVCASCHSRLQECPTCRGDFAPEMRNYALEEVIGRLQQTGLAAASEPEPEEVAPSAAVGLEEFAEVPPAVVQRVRGLINDVNGN